MELLQILYEYLEKHSDIRFSQALMNCDFVKQENRIKEKSNYDAWPELVWRDEFYLESEELLKRVKEAMKK